MPGKAVTGSPVGVVGSSTLLYPAAFRALHKGSLADFTKKMLLMHVGDSYSWQYIHMTRTPERVYYT